LAELRLRGPLFTLQIERSTDTGWMLFYHGRWRASTENVRNHALEFDWGLPSLPCKVHCLPLYLDNTFFRLPCLLLSPTGNMRGQFRRVGLLSVVTTSETARDLSSWMHPHPAVNEEWMEYEEACGEGRYIISII
jgi:hypothetical protein